MTTTIDHVILSSDETIAFFKITLNLLSLFILVTVSEVAACYRVSPKIRQGLY